MHAPDYAALARIALGHITQVYPHSGPQRLSSASDWLPPEQAHPLFCGSYDWHSCVHSHWLLVHVLNTAPQLTEAADIRQRLLQFNCFRAQSISIPRHYSQMVLGGNLLIVHCIFYKVFINWWR